MTETKTIEGKTISGEDRKYTFHLLNAATGVRLFHEYAPLIMTALPMIKELTGDGEEAPSGANIFGMLPKILKWQNVEELAKEMLADATCEINNKKFNIPEDGIADYMSEDPLELYTAIFYAVCANYPKYLAPFLTALDEDEEIGEQSKDDSISDS